MMRLRGHLVGIEQGSRVMFSDFEHDGEMWTGEGPRQNRHRVTFGEPFRAPPAVLVSLTMLDLDHSRNHRSDISAENVTAEGFDLVFRTWSDTRVARVRADWLALGELDDPEAWEVD